MVKKKGLIEDVSSMDRSLSPPRKKTHLEREQIFPALFPKIFGKNLSIKKIEWGPYQRTPK